MKTNALLFSLILVTSSIAGCFGDSDENEEQDIDSIIQEIDSDNDGVLNSVDLCPDTSDDERQMVDSSGCYDEESFLDSDNDGVVNNKDECQDSPETEPVFLNGCSITQLDFDKDGVIDTLDQCPNSPPDVATLPNGCFEGEMASSIAVRVVPEAIQNYKISKPINSIVFGFNSGQNVDNQTYYGMKYTTNIGPFTTDENNQLVIGTIHNNKFQSPENGNLMVHYTSMQLIENIPEYIATLNDEGDGGYGGLYYNSIDGDGFTEYTLEYYIWSVPIGVNESFFGPPLNDDLVGTEVCDQPPADETLFSMPNGETHNLSLYEFAGKVVVLEIGAEWCVPCQLVLQKLKELNSIGPFRDKIQFLSMSMQDNNYEEMSIEEVRERQIAEGINFPVSGTNELGLKYISNSWPMILIFTIDPSRDLALVTVAKTVGSGVDMFDTLIEVDRLFSGEFASELCNSYVKENPYDYADNDNDGLLNFEDAFPEDPSEQYDLDGDGIGDNSDLDDDGDGVSDDVDSCPETQMSRYNEIFSILHPDGCADLDGDKYNSTEDCNDFNPLLASDSDGDGYCDGEDQFPYDSTEWSDSDGDGVGDNSDAFPNDSWAQYDSDGDGVPDPTGYDYDEDGIIDEWSEDGDLCPDTPLGVDVDETGCADLDNDGWGQYFDCDDNNSEIYPGADEIQDSVDNDCDELIDEVIPPLVITVEMTPSDIFTETHIECFGNSSNGDTVILGIYVNGIQLDMWYGHGTLYSDNFVKGDIVTCVGYLPDTESSPVWNRTIVANSPPVLGGIDLQQLNNATVTCDPGRNYYYDVDGDEITFSYQWFVNGLESAVTESYLNSTQYNLGDDVTCIVTPHDGEDAGLSVSKTITIE